MLYSPPAVPEKWQSAYEAHIQSVERKVAVIAAWLLLATIMVYQFSHEIRQGQSSSLLAIEFAFRLPLILLTLITLSSHFLGKPRWSARLRLRLLALSLMAMILALLLLRLETGTTGLNYASNGLVISFFGVTMLSVRGLRELPLVFLLPMAVFIGLAAALGIRAAELGVLLFDPLVMAIIGMTVMISLRHILTSEFLARQQLREMASTDPLTGLLTRRAIRPLIEHELQRAKRAGAPFSLVLGDLDLFKRVNDTWGHEAGDRVLKETARRLGAGLRHQDALCRWGGEELLVLLPDTSVEGAREVAEKLRQTMTLPIDAHGQSIDQTISLGVAGFQADDTVDTLVSRADQALYAAKRNGRNRVEMAIPEAVTLK